MGNVVTPCKMLSPHCETGVGPTYSSGDVATEDENSSAKHLTLRKGHQAIVHTVISSVPSSWAFPSRYPQLFCLLTNYLVKSR